MLRQDLREISGISEISGVVGDGEREQAVTEEEDMIVLPKGKRRVEIWIVARCDGITDPNPGCHRSGLED